MSDAKIWQFVKSNPLETIHKLFFINKKVRMREKFYKDD